MSRLQEVSCFIKRIRPKSFGFILALPSIPRLDDESTAIHAYFTLTLFGRESFGMGFIAGRGFLKKTDPYRAWPH